MKKFFRELISDDNQINEQAFVGVISFFAMVFVLLTDVITGVIGENSMFKFKVMVESHPLAFVITCVYVPDCV